ncbi:MAG TPA: tyrosine-type recombinase/integrase, partial [Planctomycetota bacterium]|nr:tyrosine-type recombinase/integrase [Planctomycetota bacterium]
MHVFPEPYKDKKTGETRYTDTYTAEWHIKGKRRRFRTGLTNKRAAEMAAEAEYKRDLDRAAGRGDPFEKYRDLPIGEHVQAFNDYLSTKASTKKHLWERNEYLTAYIAACGVKTLADLDGARANAWLASLIGPAAEGKLSARSANKRRMTLKQFGRWLVGTFTGGAKDARMAFDPFAGKDVMPKRSEKEDKRHKRRAPTRDELEAIIAALEVRTTYAVASKRRALLYRTAATTGLRKEELHVLRAADFDLGDVAPAVAEKRDPRATVRLDAKFTKNGEDAFLPLSPETARALVAAGVDKLDGAALVFPDAPNYRTFDEDLKRAKVEKETPRGLLDFHALRVYYATALARNKVGLVQAQKLMRHSDPALTSNVYSKVELDDWAHEAAAKIDLGDSGRISGRTTKTATDNQGLTRTEEGPKRPFVAGPETQENSGAKRVSRATKTATLAGPPEPKVTGSNPVGRTT